VPRVCWGERYPGLGIPDVIRDKNSLAQSRNTIDTPTPGDTRAYNNFAFQAKYLFEQPLIFRCLKRDSEILEYSMKYLSFLLLAICLSTYADWDGPSLKTSSVSPVVPPSVDVSFDKLPLSKIKSFLDSTNIWIVVKTDDNAIYSHNRNLSIYLKKFAESTINKISNHLNIVVPENFHYKLFTFDNKYEMMEYLSDSFAGVDIERWYDNESLLTYKLSNNNKLRRNLFQDDIPYLLTLAVLNKIDEKNKIPETLKIGFAISSQQSVSNILKSFRYDLLNDDEKWIDYDVLFNTHIDAFEEPDFIDDVEAESALWAMFIRNKLTPELTGKLIYELANGADLQKSFSKAFDVGMFDTMPRLEEQARKWFENTIPDKRKKTYFISKTNRNIILLTFAGLIFIIFLIVLYKWLKDLIG